MKKISIVLFLILVWTAMVVLNNTVESTYLSATFRPEIAKTIQVTPTQTQTPEPTSTADWYVSCLDGKLGGCFQTTLQKFGWFGILALLFVVVIVMIIITPLKESLQEKMKELFKSLFPKSRGIVKGPSMNNLTEILRLVEKEYLKDPQLGASSESIRKELDLTTEDMRDIILRLQEREFVSVTWLENRAVLKVTDKGRTLLRNQ